MEKILSIWDMPVKRFVLIVSLLILLIRVVYVFTLEDKWYFFDTVHYDTAAQHIVKGEGFGPGLHYYNFYDKYSLEPVYPLFLAAVYAIFGHSFLAARIAQSILSLLTLILLFLSGRQVMPDRYARLLLVFGAVYPFFIYISGLLYATQIFTFFIVLALWIFISYYKSPKLWLMIIGGIVLGLAVLSIPVYVVALPMFVLWVILFSGQTLKKRFIAALVLGVTIVIVLIPWTVRNYLVFHEIKYARAYLPQEEAFSKVFWKFEQEKAQQKETLDVKKFSFYYYEKDEKSFLDCFINNDHFFTLNPYRKLAIPDSGYYNGLVFFGIRPNHINLLSFSNIEISNSDTITTLCWSSLDEYDQFLPSQTLHATGTEINYSGSTKNWDKPVMIDQKNNANYFEIQYPENLSPRDINRVALMAFMDTTGTESEGYMIWLHSWLEPDLWYVKNQQPDSSVAVLKYFADGRSINLSYLLSRYPFEYIFKHYLPEFCNFWSPKISRISSKEREPGFLLQVAAIVSFTPVLILFPFGIWVLRKQWQLMLLFLVPIMTISFGYSLFFTETRYRIPVDGFVMLFALAGLLGLISVFKQK